MPTPESCYHCGSPLPPGLDLRVTIANEPRAMCCAGCQAVAQAIVDAGLGDYYRHRTSPAPTAAEVVPEFLRQTEVYDNPRVQERFVRLEDHNVREASLILEGITCAACIWLNERHLRSLPGVLEVRINYSTQRALVRWDERVIRLSEILQAVSRIGYFAHPYDPARQQQVLEQERRRALRRIGLAGVLGMQVMMFSIALYVGEVEREFENLFNWINLLLTVPILLYSAEPFFRSAWRDLRQRQAGMDVPVSVGIALAFLGSLWTTLSGDHGEVYYDSIAMFVFFLLSGRYFELVARQRSAGAAESLVRLVPTTALRLRQGESGPEEESVLVAELRVGDRVRVRPGESVPADGSVMEGRSSVDESLISGESRPLAKRPGDPLVAGSVNIESPLQMVVEKIGADTVLSHILRLLERAQSEKPALTQFADRIAAWFVVAVLLLAVAVAAYWWQHDHALWLAVTLSVLVVTCPCALGLATPTAITAATSSLTRAGLLTTRGHALETLAHADTFIFDKTGTLTEGRMRLLATATYAGLDAEVCLRHAAALERHSEHPIARALLDALPTESPALNADQVQNQPGAGLHGDIEGQTWYLGTPEFVRQRASHALEPAELARLQSQGHSVVVLADSARIHAAFSLGDKIRPGARELIQGLLARGKRVSLLTGDHAAAARQVAEAVGITDLAWELSPQDKLERVKSLQAEGRVVAMFGDGVNDAPVLAQAQVSIAMGTGTQVARASADMILLGEHLPVLLHAIGIAHKTLRVIRENVAWAIGYNLLALPAAVAGYVAPWMAAIGMSLSSLLVVANAMRLLDRKPTDTDKA